MTAVPEPNPYLAAWRRSCDGDPAPGRDELLPRYGFAVPDDAALGAIAAHSPNGVVEVGAGTGYWARLLADRGVDVIAFDLAPPPSAANRWFAGTTPWFPVAAGDETVVAEHAERTLLLVWPTRDEDWAADAALLHAGVGGRRLVYVGEPPGGRTGDARFHAVLGLVERCLACSYGVVAEACTCGVSPCWRLIEELPLPTWGPAVDRLQVFGPLDATGRAPKRRWFR